MQSAAEYDPVGNGSPIARSPAIIRTMPASTPATAIAIPDRTKEQSAQHHTPTPRWCETKSMTSSLEHTLDRAHASTAATAAAWW